jgi:hypothetical protein
LVYQVAYRGCSLVKQVPLSCRVLEDSLAASGGVLLAHQR